VKYRNKKDYLLGKDSTELEEFAIQFGEPAFRGRQLYCWLYTKRAANFRSMTDLARSFREQLTEDTLISPVKVLTEEYGSDGSCKLLFGLPDGNRVEGVLIPDNERLTACLSSQVGCAIGCKFCATGKIGFKRNLSASEIVGQFIALETAANQRITNVVMMGMGEPLLNRSAVFKAARLITDPDGLGVSRRRFCISTVGWTPGILAMCKSNMRFKLTVSLNGTTDEQRNSLMRFTKRFPLLDVLKAAEKYVHIAKQRVTFTYLLLNGFNDSLEDAHRLIKLVKHIPCKVNLMEYNEIGSEFHQSDKKQTEDFQSVLRSAGLTAIIRTSRGEDIAAACGQLAGGYETNTGK